tara:strand:+ start:731 stop:1042 length:312 start_codon:yes stop_codon:yes gene_type:complete
MKSLFKHLHDKRQRDLSHVDLTHGIKYEKMFENRRMDRPVYIFSCFRDPFWMAFGFIWNQRPEGAERKIVSEDKINNVNGDENNDDDRIFQMQSNCSVLIQTR